MFMALRGGPQEGSASRSPLHQGACPCPPVPSGLLVTDISYLVEKHLSRRRACFLEGNGELPWEPSTVAFPQGNLSLAGL